MDRQPRRVADTTTGEVHLVKKEERKPYRFQKEEETGKRHMVTAAIAAAELRRAKLSAAAFRVLWHVMLITDDTCVIYQKQEEIADATELSQQSVSRALRQLLESGHLYEKGSILHLSPTTAFTGNGARHHDAVERMPEHLREDAPVRHLHPVG